MTATLDGGAPVTLDCYYPTATTSQTRRLLFSGVAAGQHKVVITLSGNKNASSQGWYFYFDFLECAVAERRSRSGRDDYRRGGGHRLRHGQHLQAVAAEAGLEHSEARAAGRDRSLLRRLLVEAVGGVQSRVPHMHGHVLRQLERSGCRLAAHWRAPRSARRCSAGRTAATPSRGISPISSTRSSTASGPRSPAAS